MTPADIKYFEDNIVSILKSFCESFLLIDIIPHSVSSHTLEYHKTIIKEEFNDEYDHEMEVNPNKLMRSETANYVLLFMFDML